MNQRVKRAIAAAMSLTMVATATPVSPLYNAIQNAVSSVMMQANAGELNWKTYENVKWAIDDGTLYVSPKDGKINVEVPYGFYSALVGDGAISENSFSSLVIGEGITTIDDEAFEYCSGLKSVTIPDSVTVINDCAFHSCDGLESVAIGSGVNIIGDSAFQWCYNLISVTFEGDVPTTIGADAFGYVRSQSNPATLYYPKDNTKSWDSFFEYNSSNITNGVLKWQEGYFKTEAYVPYTKIEGKNLKWAIDEGTLKIELDDTNKTGEQYADDNAMPDWQNTNSPWYNNTKITSVKIEDGVTKIGSYAFNGCSGLTSIALPAFLTSIGTRAFYECTSLKDIVIPASVTTIGTGIFNNCKNLKSVKFAEASQLESIEAGTFVNCLELSDITIPASVKSIGNNAFNQCNNLTDIVIPASVTTIGTGIFNNCEKLESVKFAEASKLESIEVGTFYNCKKLSDITIPASVTTIGVYAFSGCTGLTSIKFEGNVPTIGSAAFSGVGTTTPVTLYYPKDDTTWEAFLETAKSEEKIDESGVLSWQDGKFKAEAYTPWNKIDGTNLQWKLEDDGKLTVDRIVKTITDETLNAMPDWDPEQNKAPWYSVKDSIKSVEIKDGVTHIGKFAFYGYNSVTELTIGNDVTTIGNFAFDNTRIESVIIPDSVTSIGDTTFGHNTALKSVVLGNNVKSIERGAFTSTGLTSIVIPAKVTKIGPAAFSEDTYLKEIVFKGNPPEIIYESGIPAAFSNVGTQDNPVKLYYPKGNIEWDSFFKDNSSNITNGVLSWEDGNFTPVAYNTIKDNDNDTNLMWYLEDEGTDGKKLTVDLIDKTITDTTKNAMPDWQFANYVPWNEVGESITSVEINEGVTSIGNVAFYCCEMLESVTIPDGVTSIGDYAFSGCSGLTSVTIPDSVTSISDGAFEGCEMLESVTIGNGVESISNGAFYWCSGLTSVTIPDSVTSIGTSAFYKCTSLESITFEGNVPTIGSAAFSGVGTTTPVTLYYPKDNTTWETFLSGKTGEFDWEGGKFKAEAYLNWNDIADTNLHWAISVNGTLYIDKQENAEPTGNFEVPAFGDNAPWKDLISKIRFVDISSSVTGVSDKSFTDFNGQAILVLENGSTLEPIAVEGSNYDSLGGGQFIYSKSQLTGASLSLAGKIGVNVSFYVNKDEGSTITINGETVNLSECEHKGDIYTYKLWVAPRDAYKDITFKTVKGSDTIVEKTYNVKSKYVDIVLADTEHKKYNKKVFDMVTALDTYINSSRVYFNEVGEAEATAIKTEIDTALEGLNLSGLNEYVPNIASESAEGFEYYGSSLILNSGVKLRHYITIENEDIVANIKIKVGDDEFGSKMLEKASFTSNSHDVYYFETDEFNPEDFGTNVSVTYNDKKIIDNYSVLTFISLSLGNAETAATELGTTCKSIYNYYLAADTYNKN